VDDATTNNNDGTLGADSGSSTDDPTWTTGGRFGNALTFDGTSDLVQVPDDDSLDITAAITLEAWIKPSDVSSPRTIVAKWEEADPKEYSYRLIVRSEKIRFEISTSGTSAIRLDSSTKIGADVWTHVAATYDGSTMKVYKNGVMDNSKAQTGAIYSSTTPLRIGHSKGTSEYFSGIIDEVGLYSVAKSDTDIANDYLTSRQDIFTSDGTTSFYGLQGADNIGEGRVSFRLNLDNDTYSGFTVASMSGGDKYEVDFQIGTKQFALYFVATAASRGRLYLEYGDACSAGSPGGCADAAVVDKSATDIVSGNEYNDVQDYLRFRLTDSTSQGTVEMEVSKSYLASLGASGSTVSGIAGYTFSGSGTTQTAGANGGTQQDRSPSGSGTASFDLSQAIPDLPLGLLLLVVPVVSIYLYLRRRSGPEVTRVGDVG